MFKKLRNLAVGATLVASTFLPTHHAGAVQQVDFGQNACDSTVHQDLGWYEAAYGSVHITCWAETPDAGIRDVCVDYFPQGHPQDWFTLRCDGLPQWLAFDRLITGDQWNHVPLQLQFTPTTVYGTDFRGGPNFNGFYAGAARSALGGGTLWSNAWGSVKRADGTFISRAGWSLLNYPNYMTHGNELRCFPWAGSGCGGWYYYYWSNLF